MYFIGVSFVEGRPFEHVFLAHLSIIAGITQTRTTLCCSITAKLSPIHSGLCLEPD